MDSGIEMDFSTAEWKSRIQDHERKTSVEVNDQKLSLEKQKRIFLETVNHSYKSEYSNVINRLEESHKKSREATLAVLNQLYSDYDTYKKETQQNFYELNYNLSTTEKDAKQNISNLNNALEKLTKEKEAENESNTEKIRLLENLLTMEMETSKGLRSKLSETEDTLATSMIEHAEEIQKSNKLQDKLSKTENALEISKTLYSQETQNSKKLSLQLKTTEKDLKDTKVELKMLKIEKSDADEAVDRCEVKIEEFKKKFGQCKDELKEAREVIENLKSSQKQRTGPTVDFFNSVRIVNIPPCVCDGTQKSMVYLNVSEMVELESIGFLGPLNCDAIYEVMLQVNQMKPRGNKWKNIAQVMKRVTARRQQVFHVDFDEPIILEDYASDEQNSFTNANGFYNIYFTLKGQNTQSADILNGIESKEICKEKDGVMFYTKWFHNQWAEFGFQKSLKYKSLVIF